MDPNQFEVGAWAMVNYFYRTSGYQFVADVYGEVAPPYRDEKADAWAKSQVRAVGYLDSEHRAKLFTAVKKLENEARIQLQ